MSKPPPYILAPTMLACHQAIRALYAAGYETQGYPIDKLIALMSPDDTCAQHPYVIYKSRDLGIYSKNHSVAGYTLCNSVQHMIAYLNRQ